MAGSAGRSDAPSYSRAVTEGSKDVGKKHFKKPLEKISKHEIRGHLGKVEIRITKGINRKLAKKRRMEAAMKDRFHKDKWGLQAQVMHYSPGRIERPNDTGT